MRRALVLFLLSLALGASPAAAKDGWSKPVDGLQARLTFGPGRHLRGDYRPEVFLELRNSSNILTPLEVEFDGSKTVRFDLRSAAGRPAPRPRVIVASIWIADPYRIALPPGGTLRFPVSVQGYNSTGGVVKICLPDAVWDLPRRRATWLLSATFQVARPPPDPEKLEPWHGTLRLPPVRVPLAP